MIPEKFCRIIQNIGAILNFKKVVIQMKVQEMAKKMAAKSMTKAAERTALFTGESACVWWQYQPKAPAALKKMKKR